MDSLQRTMIEVWQEISRHLEMDDAIGNIRRIAKPLLPTALLDIAHLDHAQFAVELALHSESFHRRRAVLGPREFLRVAHWCRAGQSVHLRATQARPAELRALTQRYEERELMIGALAGERGGPGGIVFVVAPHGVRWNAPGFALFEALTSPLAVAVANDARLRELKHLREAAEAGQRSLLQRLGRADFVESIVGSGSGLQETMERVKLVARSDSSVLLVGETGSGKEVVARAIHDRSARSRAAFIRVNCGAIAPELIDSELFGHEKGSFTGASTQRTGWFERADGGTLFLDEVGELPPAAQVRLLRVLQDGEVTRVGGENLVHTDVRIVAATHRDLLTMTQGGAFRQDLWYRIAVFPILIPPLRERVQDIEELASHFARRAAIKLGLPLQLPDDQDVSLLKAYAWPGNARELSTVIERAAILGNGHGLRVSAAMGGGEFVHSLEARPAASSALPADLKPLNQAMADHIRSALTRTQGRVSGPQGAARLLDINPHTLRSRMRKLGIAAH